MYEASEANRARNQYECLNWECLEFGITKTGEPTESVR